MAIFCYEFIATIIIRY